MTDPKILIVDDEPFNVDYLEQELEDSEYKLISAVNGQDALNKVQSESPDLILLDIMMPVMDGFEVLRRLKADAATRDIPVIVISANNDLHSVVKGIQFGAEDYLPKPFEPTLLHARVSSSLEKKRLRDIEHLYLKSLERELDIGHDIQQGFLPSELPKLDGWEIAAYFQAAREVAGDFYDAFLLPDGNLLCAVGDVCDKGVGAALFMTLFRSLIRVTATTDVFHDDNGAHIPSPRERLNHVISFTNKYIAETHFEANMFATIFVGIFNPQDGTLTYVNCGNEPALIVQGGNVAATLPPTGPVAGLFSDAKFTIKEASLQKNNILLAFTDGIPDSKNSSNEFLSTKRLIESLGEVDISASALVRKIETQLHDFIGSADQYDDITLLVIKRNA